MSSLLPEVRTVDGHALFETTIEETHVTLLRTMSERINLKLSEAVAHVLDRQPYVRRVTVANWIEHVGACPRCHSLRSNRLSRNGSRPRTLTTRWGDLQIRWPRLVCECGGSVALHLGDWLKPYQRLGPDVDAQIERWGALSISLREMQRELAHSYIGPLGQRTLMQRLHQLQALTPDLADSATPPILQIDAIWFTQLRPTGQWRQDRKGRRRQVKSRVKRCILIALGVWPESGRQEVLAWRLANSEDTAAWLDFLSHLEAQGIRGENGLRLVIHDGGSGLCSALHTVDFGAAEQRCLFHKLRNIAKAIQVPDNLSAEERRRRRKAILKDFTAIWAAKAYATVLRRYLSVVRQYRDAQPGAVATLRRDFRATVTYFLILQQHPTWPRQFVRTTSRLERVNRPLRKRLRNANAYHSDTGVLAMVAQVADRTFQPGTRSARV